MAYLDIQRVSPLWPNAGELDSTTNAHSKKPHERRDLKRRPQSVPESKTIEPLL